MLIARNLNTPKIPKGIAKILCVENEVVESKESVPLLYDGASWVGCYSVWPHTDDFINLKSKVTVLLVVKADGHRVADIKFSTGSVLKAGDLCVINPRTVHWLEPRHAHKSQFIALLWDVGFKHLKEFTQNLVQTHCGSWVDISDVRYKKLKP